MKNNDGGPAFPETQYRKVEDGANTYLEPIHFGGMTLRDWFAGQVIMGRAAYLGKDERGLMDDLAEEQAINAYALADALLKEREKENS